MPDDPVIIDDGGSTRIKQLKDGVKMDNLLGDSLGVFSDKADGAWVDTPPITIPPTPPSFLCTLKVRYNSRNGQHSILPDNPPGTPSGLALQSSDQIVVVSKHGQLVTITFDSAFLMVITLSANVAGIDPIVDAKQDGKQRRYIVTNAGPIKTVSYIRGGTETFIANFFGTPPVTGFPTTPSIYTMLHFRNQPL